MFWRRAFAFDDHAADGLSLARADALARVRVRDDARRVLVLETRSACQQRARKLA